MVWDSELLNSLPLHSLKTPVKREVINLLLELIDTNWNTIHETVCDNVVIIEFLRQSLSEEALSSNMYGLVASFTENASSQLWLHLLCQLEFFPHAQKWLSSAGQIGRSKLLRLI